jgi:hypothetical protein
VDPNNQPQNKPAIAISRASAKSGTRDRFRQLLKLAEYCGWLVTHGFWTRLLTACYAYVAFEEKDITGLNLQK